MHFFWPNLRCKVIEQMVKSRYLVEFPAQKKEPKWFQNLGRFKKNSSAQWPNKGPKIGPGLALAWTWSAETGSSSGKRLPEMPNLRLKVRTQRRPAQCSGGDRLPERRSFETYCGGPWIWGWQNCNSRAQMLDLTTIRVHIFYRRRETSIKSMDVARHRETSIKFIDVAGHRETSIKSIDVTRHRETSRDIDNIYRRRETSRDFDKIYRRHETSRDIERHR